MNRLYTTTAIELIFDHEYLNYNIQRPKFPLLPYLVWYTESLLPSVEKRLTSNLLYKISSINVNSK